MIPTYSIQDFFDVNLKFPDFHINKLEEMPVLPARIKSPHKHAFYEVFLLVDGEMSHNIDFNEFELQKDCLFFISKGQYHFWAKTKRKSLKGFRLMFSEQLVDNIFLQNNFLFELVYINNIYHSPLLKISVQDHHQLLSYFQLLYNEYIKDDVKMKAIQANLYLLLLEVQRMNNAISKESANTYHLKIYQQFIQHVEINFAKKYNADFYAQQLNLSLNQLNKIVKKYAQVAIGKVIQNRILLEAKRLLFTSSLSVNEISNEIGIEDTSYFIRLFKKNEGITPEEFRKKRS